MSKSDKIPIYLNYSRNKVDFFQFFLLLNMFTNILSDFKSISFFRQKMDVISIFLMQRESKPRKKSDGRWSESEQEKFLNAL
jgi:hypothetical protein